MNLNKQKTTISKTISKSQTSKVKSNNLKVPEQSINLGFNQSGSNNSDSDNEKEIILPQPTKTAL